MSEIASKTMKNSSRLGTNSRNSSTNCSEKIRKTSRFCILREKSRIMGVKNMKSGNNSERNEKSMKYPKAIVNTGEKFNDYTHKYTF